MVVKRIYGKEVKYGEVKGIGDIREINRKIRKEAVKYKFGDELSLTNLYRRSRYLRTLCNSSAWEKEFRGKLIQMKKVAEEEFSRTARVINRKCEQLGMVANYVEKWKF